MPISAKMCEIVSDTEHLTLETIQKVIGEQTCIDKYLYILHDKDKKEDGTPKNPHRHVYLHFNNARCFDNIAKWFGLPVSFVSKIKGRFGDAVEYALHRNAPEKYQYPASDAVANFDFEKTIEQNQEYKAKRQNLANIIADIETGEIKRYNIVDKVSMADYVRYEKQINKAFEYNRMRLEREVDRKMEVIYMFGASGTGKTTYAKMIAKKQKYEIFTSSGSNDPFDGYKGQECVILDDLRGSVFPLSDLLKILDNDTASSVKARYKNINLECKLLIITTTKTPAEFYKQVFESQGEEFKQFLRRCTQIVEVCEKTIYVRTYNADVGKHVPMGTFANPVAELLALHKFNKERSQKHINELFSFAKQDLQGMIETFQNNPQLLENLSKSDVKPPELDLSEYEDILSLEDIPDFEE